MIISYYESDYIIIIIIIIIAELSRAIVAKSSLVRRRRVCNKRRCLLYTASRMASCPDDRVMFYANVFCTTILLSSCAHCDRRRQGSVVACTIGGAVPIK